MAEQGSGGAEASAPRVAGRFGRDEIRRRGRLMQQQDSAATFSGGVVVLFGTQVFGAAMGFFSGILLARLLGPDGKGEYYIVVLLPATALVLLQFGLPQAFNFFSARRRTARIVTKAFTLTAVLAVLAFLGLLVLLPVLSQAILRGVAVEQVVIAFLAFPQALFATLTTGIVLGRKAVRWYAGVTVIQSIASDGAARRRPRRPRSFGEQRNRGVPAGDGDSGRRICRGRNAASRGWRPIRTRLPRTLGLWASLLPR